MEEKLIQIFANINDWLKYSEVKNGVLLSLNSAVVMGFISLLKDAPIPLKFSINLCLIPSFTLSLIVLLSSFLPILDKLFNKKDEIREINGDNINLLFYGDLRKLSTSVYLKLLYQSCNEVIPESFEKLELDLANQIIINSVITYRKLIFFRIGAYIDFIGIFSGISLFFIQIVLQKG